METHNLPQQWRIPDHVRRKIEELQEHFVISGDVWRVPGTSNLAVSSEGGHVLQWSDGRVRLLRRFLSKSGYYQVTLVGERGDRKTEFVHRLVCLTFHGPPPSGKRIVRHLNDNKRDNSFDNLRWGTNAENLQDARLNQVAERRFWTSAQWKEHHDLGDGVPVYLSDNLQEKEACVTYLIQQLNVQVFSFVSLVNDDFEGIPYASLLTKVLKDQRSAGTFSPPYLHVMTSEDFISATLDSKGFSKIRESRFLDVSERLFDLGAQATSVAFHCSKTRKLLVLVRESHNRRLMKYEAKFRGRPRGVPKYLA